MEKLTQQELESVLQEFSSRMAMHFGSRMRDARLFGSYARGTAHAGSDVDVLVVLEPPKCSFQDNEVIGEILSDLCIEYGALVLPVIVSEEEYRTTDLAFFRNVRRESIAV
jgi:predicted nucleotidyltransferase